MKKIIIVGSPGSGKSHVSRLIGEKLNYPVFHMDRIYWKENWDHVSKEELIQAEDDINLNNENWIIDGNHLHTLDHRLSICDTVILLDIDPELCVTQELARRNKKRPDFPEFLNEGEDPNFVTYIRNFNKDLRPLMDDLFKNYPDKEYILLHNHEEEDEFINNIK